MKKHVIFFYGLLCYALFIAMLLYAVGFIGGFFLPRTLDSGAQVPTSQAIVTDVILLIVFGLQHSIMARARFKQWWTKLIPPSAERSTYVLVSSLLLLFLMWLWQPVDSTVWQVESSIGRVVVYGIYALGLIIFVTSTFLINHAAFAGLQQVYRQLSGKTEPAATRLRAPLLYRWVRHPMMLGLLLAFWAAPTMTVGHLLFAAGMTMYILIGVSFEERQLVRDFGRVYEEYRRTTPMFIPLMKR